MAHYAFLDENNIVTEVIVGRDEDDLAVGVDSWEEYYGQMKGQVCKRTSYNTKSGVYYVDGQPSDNQSKAFRGNYAGIGMTYREDLDAFIAQKPFESWILNESSFNWEAPIPYPEDGEIYTWNEEGQTWDLIQLDEQ